MNARAGAPASSGRREPARNARRRPQGRNEKVPLPAGGCCSRREVATERAEGAVLAPGALSPDPSESSSSASFLLALILYMYLQMGKGPAGVRGAGASRGNAG